MGGRQNTSVRRLDYTEKEWNSKRADWEVIAAVCNSVTIVRFQLKGTLSDKQFSGVEAVYGDWEIQRVGAVKYAKVGTLYSISCTQLFLTLRNDLSGHIMTDSLFKLRVVHFWHSENLLIIGNQSVVLDYNICSTVLS